jgi:dihydrofolate reductase
MKLSIVAAMSENRVIGRGAEIPWRLPAEQKLVRELTMGHCLIMGRKTWNTIGRALPGRTSIVMTRNDAFTVDLDGVFVVPDFDAALALARERGDDEAFVFGGEDIYAQALEHADTLYLTTVHAQVDGDAFFPRFDEAGWKLASETRYEADERNEHAFTIRRYER